VGVILGLPVFEALLDLPGFNLLRRHRFSFLLIFALGHLSALGAENLIRGLWTRKAVLRVLALTSLLCTGFFVLGVLEYQEFLKRLDPTGTTYLSALWVFGLLLAGAALLLRSLTRPILLMLILLVMLDLSWNSYNLNSRGDARSLFPKSQLASSLLARKPVPRIFSFYPIFNPNTAMVYGLQDVRGYDVITPRRLFRFMQEIDPDLGNILNWLYSLDPDDLNEWTLTRRAVDKALEDYGEELRRYYASESYWTVGIKKVENRQFFDLLQIDYMLGPGVDDLKDFEKVLPDQAVQVLGNPTAERCRLYFDWVESSDPETLERMKGYDLRASVLVETRLPVPPDIDDPPEFLIVSSSGVQQTCYRVETDRSAVLVEFERFSPGWYALLDGKTLQEVFPAQHLFRGMLVPPGKHTVEFRYDPPAVRYGLAISLAGLFVLLAILTFDLPHRLRNRSSDRLSAPR
jgi:hypothetical protein